MASPREPNQNPHPRRPRRREPMPGGWLWILIMMFFLVVLLLSVGLATSPGMSYTQFMRLAQEKYFSQVTLRGENTAVGTLRPEKLKELDESLKKFVRGGKTVE